jgi:diguanylate cyclase (GGDEF)-like protein
LIVGRIRSATGARLEGLRNRAGAQANTGESRLPFIRTLALVGVIPLLVVLAVGIPAVGEIHKLNRIGSEFDSLANAMRTQLVVASDFLITGKTSDELTQSYLTAEQRRTDAEAQLATEVEGDAELEGALKEFEQASSTTAQFAVGLSELSDSSPRAVRRQAAESLPALEDARNNLNAASTDLRRLLRERSDETASLAFMLAIAGTALTWAGITALAIFLVRRLRRSATSRLREEDAQREAHSLLIEALQFAEDEEEVAEILVHHAESVAPGSETVVLRSDDRGGLEAAPLLAVNGGRSAQLAARLENASAQDCLAIRRGRTNAGESKAFVSCALCGSEAGACVPMTVRGTVLGAVNVMGDGVGEVAVDRLQGATAHAAPVVANMRTLALAERRAATDFLTELPNRRQFDEALERYVSSARRHGRPVALMLLDIDKLKEVNDRFGHERGDLLLRSAADGIRDVVRGEDLAARIGGDEFAIVLAHSDRAGADEVAQRIRQRLHRAALEPGVRHGITASIGIASLPEDATDAASLVRCADTALYLAKKAGRDSVRDLTPQDD